MGLLKRWGAARRCRGAPINMSAGPTPAAPPLGQRSVRFTLVFALVHRLYLPFLLPRGRRFLAEYYGYLIIIDSTRDRHQSSEEPINQPRLGSWSFSVDFLIYSSSGFTVKKCFVHQTVCACSRGARRLSIFSSERKKKKAS